ncbi:hypothetical protein L21SP2_2455 [Salinispira pacifica]|uniref:Uncharacterized protein n=1 Tax=Salinispira pacifica TaxID=1307761 RepID=V5WJ44_9SPIO|nr:hypothetical protein L21SP2_2455 [Salinispira pacifica]
MRLLRAGVSIVLIIVYMAAASKACPTEIKRPSGSMTPDGLDSCVDTASAFAGRRDYLPDRSSFSVIVG